MKRTLHITTIACLLCAGTAGGQSTPPTAATPATAAAPRPQSLPRVFVDYSLRQRTLRLTGISEDSISAIAENGKAAQISRSEVLAIMPQITHASVTPAGGELNVWRDPSLKDEAPLGRCDLVDGQIIPGLLWPAGTKGDHVGWDSRLWGKLSLPLESLCVLTLRNGGSGKRDGVKNDVVWFANGDRTSGFVASVGETISLEHEGKTNTFPAERVAGIGFTNARTASKGIWFWLYDGTVGATSSLTATRDTAKVTASIPSLSEPPSATLDPDEIRAIAFDRGRLATLAGLPLRGSGAAANRRWTPVPIIADPKNAPLGAADIELPGPMSAEWELPAGAQRLSALCELPPTCHAWGDCELFVELVLPGGQSRALWQHRLNGADPEASFNITLEGVASDKPTLVRLRIDPGENGPIQDRVIIRRALILVGSGAGPR